MKFFGEMGCGRRTCRLDFGGNLVRDPDPGFLVWDRYPEAGIF